MSESLKPEDIEFVTEEAGDAIAPADQDAELEEYSEKVQKRINAEVAKRGELERRLAVANERLDLAGRVAQQAIGENQTLKQGQAASDKAILEGLVSRMMGEVEIAKNEFKKATEEGDTDKITEANVKLATAASDLRTVQLKQAGYRPPVQAAPNPQQQPQQPPRQQAQPKALAWVERNKDKYGKDAVWTREARAADVMVAALGHDPSSDEYYNEVDKVIAMRLSGNRGGENRDRSPHTPVTPSGRAAVPPRPPAGKVTLTPSEVATAKRLGLTPESYASAKRAGNVVLG